MGLLHDIGRREGVFQLRHGMDGYKYLINEGYPDHARICITHSYTVKDKNNFGHYDDLTAPERRFVTRFLSETEYDDYDRLIQLADFLGLPQRLCTVDERIADVLSRTPDPSPEFLKNVFAKRELDAYFNRKILAGIKR
jgi:phosphopantetheinyl transferase (holo-ACP synthase)